jgi:CDP-diacylglycerol pyrophosphatase
MVTARALRTLSIAAAILGVAQTACADRLALWHIVHDQCVAGFTRNGNPAPCQAVRIEGGVDRGDVVLKDLIGTTQFLLIPTGRVTGIEDPVVLQPDAPNYFADAWQAIGIVAEYAHAKLPRDDLSVAVNAEAARSQDQLHIHMDCVRADVRDALHRMAGNIAGSWTPLAETIDGHRYQAMRINGDSMDATNPFRSLADGVPGAKGEMGHYTLVVVGMTYGDGMPGFVLLEGQGDANSGEDLQDHDCAVAGR